MIKVLIADDQELIRESLKIILDSKPDVEVTDAVSDGLEVIRSVRENKPDIILLDIRMPRLDGVSCTKIIKEGYPDIKIIILTTFDDDEYVFNNAVVIENKTLNKAWYIPTRIKIDSECIGKFISVKAKKNQKGKLRPFISIHE